MDRHGGATPSGQRTRLTDRDAEREVLDQLLHVVRSGESRVLVVRGDPGVGKTVLLDYVAERARGCRVVRATGVQSEMELAFAGLHQLCAPLLDHLERIPAPQQEALRTAFGVAAGPPPDRFVIGLAVLSLLSEVARDEPLICLVDDEQWLDRASEQTLGFVARRLGADPIGLVFSAREPGTGLAGQPDLKLAGLPPDHAGELLDSALPGPLDAKVRDLIIAETRGNPLALLELPRGLTPAELAGGFGLPAATPLTGRIEQSFLRQLEALPAPARRLLQLAAADPSGDRSLLLLAAERLNISVQAATPAVEAGLIEFTGRVQFRHPLARSAAYRSATLPERRQVHAALGAVTDPRQDPDRRVWHLAQAVPDRDAGVADELERSASRAQARGGVAAAAAFLERSALLTGDPAHRARRALAAAAAKVQAGASSSAQDLLAVADTGALNDREQARLELIRARLASVSSRDGEAPLLLLRAARRLERVDVRLARATYLDAMAAAMFAGRLASPGGSVLDVARAATAAPAPPDQPRPPDLLLDGTAVMFTRGYAAGLPLLRQALTAAEEDTSDDEEPHWLWLACVMASHVWDDERWELLSQRYVTLVRRIGALAELPMALDRRARPLLFAGDLAAAVALLDETRTIEDATGSPPWPYGALNLAAFRGDQATAAALISSILRDVTKRGEGYGIACAEWANSVLNNGLGRSRDAMAAARRAIEYREDLGFLWWSLVELIEAAAHAGQRETAVDAYDRLTEMTGPAGTDWALGLAARARALIGSDAAAEDGYREAIDRLGRTRIRVDLARAHLLYGEWLRRANRRADARQQLRTAHDLLMAMGVTAFAERARRELAATGEKVHARSTGPATALTAQEAHIARLARDGHTNPEIGAQLFLSVRTVEWHLRKIFIKLGIGSRRELGAALDQIGPDRPAALERSGPDVDAAVGRPHLIHGEPPVRRAPDHGSGADVELRAVALAPDRRPGQQAAGQRARGARAGAQVTEGIEVAAGPGD
jgi:DNA-binding CsgD family transcriptional regulator/tetratricopeptide (TPR) repeat protein